MTNSLSDIAAGKAKRQLGANSGPKTDGDNNDSALIKLGKGQRLIATYENSASYPSSYKDKEGNPMPDVKYYRFTVAEDTKLTRPVKDEDGNLVGVEPIKVGDKVTLRGIGDLPDAMDEAEAAMLLEIEFIGTRPTKSGFNFSNFIVNALEG